MSVIAIGVLLLMTGILIPAGIVLGLILGVKLLLWWLDRALSSVEDDERQ